MYKLKIVTFNLRTSGACDGINQFLNRVGNVLDKIDKIKPDIIGFQELNAEMRSFLIRHMPEYSFIGRPRSAQLNDERVDIAYLSDSLDVWESGFFWLSPTPWAPGSFYSDQSSCERITTYAMFKHHDIETPFRVYNTHLDHVGIEARTLGARQIINCVRENNAKIDLPYFITGDLNASPDEQCIREILNSEDPRSYDLTSEIKATFHDWGKTGAKIDYIFADSRIIDTDNRNYEISIWDELNNGVYLSDHYPVMCEIEF